MAEPFETLREVGVALNGFRSEVSGQFTNLKWIMGGVAFLGVGVAGALFVKIDALEETAARNTAILERLEKTLTDVAMDTSRIKDTVQTAQAVPTSPSPNVFPGWTGKPYSAVSADFTFSSGTIDKKLSEAWIFFPANN